MAVLVHSNSLNIAVRAVLMPPPLQVPSAPQTTAVLLLPLVAWSAMASHSIFSAVRIQGLDLLSIASSWPTVLSSIATVVTCCRFLHIWRNSRVDCLECCCRVYRLGRRRPKAVLHSRLAHTRSAQAEIPRKGSEGQGEGVETTTGIVRNT